MIIKPKQDLIPYGATRTVRRFAWWPKWVNQSQWCWLGFYKVDQFCTNGRRNEFANFFIGEHVANQWMSLKVYCD